MSILRGFIPALIAIVIGIVAVVVLSPWINSNRIEHNGAPIGRVTHSEGSVRRIHHKDIDIIPSPTLKDYPVRDGDQLQSSVQSKADLTLGDRDNCELPEGSAVKLRYADAKNTGSPIYVIRLFGQFHYPQTPTAHRILVIEDGKLYLAGQKEGALGLKVGKTGEFPKPSAADRPTDPEMIPKELSNGFINSIVASHGADLQKCWKESKPADGQKFEVKFAITAAGAATKAAAPGVSPLEQCVTKVFNGLFFHPHTGGDISLAYPLDFQ